MAGKKDVSVSGMFADVARLTQNGEWQKALKISSKLVSECPEDAKAVHCKVVCLIQVSQFQEAVNVINKHSKVTGDLSFEKAYSLYRLNKTPEALAVLEAITKPSHKTRELQAQVLYRMQRYNECYELYCDLIKNSQDDYEDERETNLAAVIANLHATDSKLAKEVAQTREHTFELTYNSACKLVAQKRYKDAEVKLSNAEELCRKTLEDDDLPEDEIDSELGIIKVQRGFAIQMLGRKDEAAQLYGQVLKQKPTDIGLAAVASNNIVVINKDQNVFDSKKKIKAATAPGLEQQLTKEQQRIIALNQVLLAIPTNQTDQCKEQLKTLKSQYPNCHQVALVEAAILCHEKNVDKAVAVLEAYSKGHADEKLKISFSLVQLQLMQGQVSQACDTLKSLGDLSYKPGVVSALVTLYLSIKDKSSAEKVLEQAVEWYKKNHPKKKELVVLWREAADYYVRNGNAEAASRSLEELRKVYPKDMKILAQLITAYAKYDTKKAKQASNDLPPVAEVSRSVDVDALETMAWSMGSKHIKKTGKGEPSPGVLKSDTPAVAPTVELIKKRRNKKKKRKVRLPKDYDPTMEPDPERWLPRRERTTFFKKRKERPDRYDRRGGGGGGGSSIGKGTQGSTAGSADMDIQTKVPLAGGSPRATPPSASSMGSRQQRQSQNQQKKKKKKGGKR